jgi:hypothetical protein
MTARYLPRRKKEKAMPDKPGNEVRLPQGQRPPEFIEHTDGRRYKPVWLEVTTDSDRRSGQDVYVISAMGDPVDQDDDDNDDRN